MKKDSLFWYHIRFLKTHKLKTTVTIVFIIAAAGFEGASAGLLIPLLGALSKQHTTVELSGFMKMLMDAFLNLFAGYSYMQQFIFAVIAILIMVTLKNICKSISEYLSTAIQTDISADIRKQGIALILEVGLAFFSTIKAGDIVERINKQSMRLSVNISKGFYLVGLLAPTIVLLYVLFAISWKLTLVALASAAFLTLALNGFMRYINKQGLKTAQAGTTFIAHLFEAVSGIQLIKAYAKEEEIGERLDTVVDEHRRALLRVRVATQLVSNITELLSVIVLGAFVIVSIKIFEQINPETYIVPSLFTFVFIMTRLIPKMQYINKTRAAIVGNEGHVRMLKQFLDRHDKPFMKSGSYQFSGLQHEIRFDDVTFTYPGSDKPALNNVSCVFPKGETVALVGESGAGKSTMINLIMKFYEAQSGSVTIDNRRVSDYDSTSYRSRCGIVSQDTFIFNASVRENIAFSVRGVVDDAKVIEAAERANAHKFIMQMPHKYDTIVGDRGIKLSGGQRQRISIARAILEDPDILILDEATSFLDTVTEQLIQEALESLSHGRTVIVIAHRLSTIEKAEHIIVLKGGCIVEKGSHAELLGMHGYYEELYQHQFRLALANK